MFRIQPGISDEPIQRSFENAKLAVSSSLLVASWDCQVVQPIALLELAAVVKIPYLLRQNSLETTPAWERGALSYEFSCIAQAQTFTGHVMGAALNAAPVDLITPLVCVVPAGAKVYRAFTGFLPAVDLRPYDGIVIAHEVVFGPTVPDRYTITTQLTFRPFAPFARP